MNIVIVGGLTLYSALFKSSKLVKDWRPCMVTYHTMMNEQTCFNEKKNYVLVFLADIHPVRF